MSVSSQSLFHFTKSRKSLENILLQKFKLAYCKENLQIEGFNSKSVYFPMVTFCDLPLSLIKEHIGKYGSYGIGMTKEWGIRQGLNPVLYLEAKSNISKIIRSQASSYLGIAKTFDQLLDKLPQGDPQATKLVDHLNESADSYFDIIRYSKNYEGDLLRGGKIYRKYRFYDEREWRFVANRTEQGVTWAMDDKEFKKYRGKSIEKPLIENPVLQFDCNDIKYLIVKNAKDVSPLIAKINSIKNLCSTRNEADILTTKIITVDSLSEDF